MVDQPSIGAPTEAPSPESRDPVGRTFPGYDQLYTRPLPLSSSGTSFRLRQLRADGSRRVDPRPTVRTALHDEAVLTGHLPMCRSCRR
jgi:hypothetical protein